MSWSIRCLVGVSAFIVLVCCHTKGAAWSTDVDRASYLWEKAIVAKGGRDRLHSIKVIAVGSLTRYQKPEAGILGTRSKELMVLPDRYWVYGEERSSEGLSHLIDSYDFGAAQLGWDSGTNASSVFEVRPPTLAESQMPWLRRVAYSRYEWRYETFVNRQLLYMMETRWLRPQILGARKETVAGTEFDVIETKFGRETVEFYLYRDSHLPVKVVFRIWFEKYKSEEIDAFDLRNYVEVDGIKMPSSVARSGGKDESAFSFNVDYNADIFKRPPTRDDGPDAWKRKTPSP